MAIEKELNIEKISEEVKAAEHVLFDAIKEKDTATIDEILTENFVYQNVKYGEISRKDFLDNIKNLAAEIESVSSNSLSVKVLEHDLAIITGIQKSVIIDNDQQHISSVAFMDIFVCQNNRWLLDYANGIDIESNSEE